MRTQQNREDEKKIAEWLGWTDVEQSHGDDSQYQGYKPTNGEPPWNWSVLPCWSTCDADAISLLPELVKRNIRWFLGLDTDEIDDLTGEIRIKVWKEGIKPIHGFQPTIAQAITAAILRVINSEI